MRELRRFLGSQVAWTVAAAAAAFALTAGLIAYANHGGRPTLHVDVELTPNACCDLQIWVNGFGPSDSTTVSLKPGTRSTYSVPLNTQFVHNLRIVFAPSSVGDTTTLHRVWTARGDRTVDELSPEDLRQVAGFAPVTEAKRGGITLRTTSPYPYIDAGSGLVTDAGPRRLFFIELGEKPLPATAAILLLAAALTATFAAAGRRHVIAFAAVGATLLVVLALPWVTQDALTLRDDVSEAVGYSPYAGIWKLRERMILELAAFAAFAIPALAALGLRLRRRDLDVRQAAAPVESGSGPRLRRRTSIAILLVPIALLALRGMPDLRAMVGTGRGIEYSPQFDNNNFLFWRYLIRRTNLEPMEDFFWPYGFQWIFQESLPWGELAFYAVYLSFWVWLVLGTYWALARFFAGRQLILRYAGLMGFWLLVALSGLIPFPTRYVGPLAVVLLYAGISAHDRLLSARRLVFAVALAELTLFELAQALYALVPIVFLAGTELVLDVRRRAELLHWVRGSVATVAVPFLVALGLYAATGTLEANISYYRELDALNSAYAYPTTIDEWIDDPRTIEAFVLWAVPLTIALGMCGLLLQRGSARRASAVVVALGVLALMVMQKQVLRPHVAPQIWQTTLFGLSFWAAVDTSLNAVRRSIAVAAAGATAAAVIVMSGELRSGWEAVTRGPERAVATVDALFTRRDDFAADEQVEFAPERFQQFGGYAAVVRALRSDPAVRGGGRVWILGDDSPLTILLGSRWLSYYLTFYDASPLSFQRRMLSRLADHPPQRVVWNFLATSYDTVPHVVRVPLLFDWAVRRFAPHRLTDAFAILRPLRPAEPPHLEWWRSKLGPSVNLGHAPEAASVHGDECSGRETCESYLVIEYPESATPPPEVAVPIRVGTLPFEVRFPTSPDASRYVVRLSRLWFWSAAPEGSRRRVVTTGLQGARARLERRTIDGDTLY
jgi:hypothetical protein